MARRSGSHKSKGTFATAEGEAEREEQNIAALQVGSFSILCSFIWLRCHERDSERVDPSLDTASPLLHWCVCVIIMPFFFFFSLRSYHSYLLSFSLKARGSSARAALFEKRWEQQEQQQQEESSSTTAPGRSISEEIKAARERRTAALALRFVDVVPANSKMHRD